MKRENIFMNLNELLSDSREKKTENSKMIILYFVLQFIYFKLRDFFFKPYNSKKEKTST
jgi:hypothetical protein